MTNQQFIDILKRDAVEIYSIESLQKKLESGKKLRIKLGADPSRPDLHLGHSVVLRKLKLFQDMGHEIVFVIGDFTGMIGDPTGKSKTRPSLTLEETRQSGKSYFEQVTKILNPEKTVIVYNSEWLNAMNFAEVIMLAGKYTLARILERDDFKKRYTENKPIGLHEMLYPLVQGYDSVALHADIEIGGTDQTFNLLVGRELQKCYEQEPQEVITFPLLPGLDGVEKMSKSLNNYIGISEPPEIMFEKAMKIPDNILNEYFRLTTDMDMPYVNKLINNDIREAHFVYAREIVKTYHSDNAADFSEKRYREISNKTIPDNVESIHLSSVPISIIDLIKSTGFAKSNSEARRLIQEKAIKLNSETVCDVFLTVEPTKNVIISKGKSMFFKIIFDC